MKTCPECGAHTDENICPSCGADLTSQEITNDQQYSQNKEVCEESVLEETHPKEQLIEGTTTETVTQESVLAEEQSKEASKNNGIKVKKWMPIVGAILVLAIAFFAFIQPKVIKPMQDYNYAIEQLENGNIAEAKKVFTSLGDYKDSVKQLDNCEVALGDKHLNDGEYELALEIYEQYKDNENVTEDKINKCKRGIYQAAIDLLESGDAEKAKQKFAKLGDYSDSKAYIEKCDKAIEKAAKEAAAKKAAEEKAAAERAAKYGKLDSSLSDIMKVYMDKYSSIHAYSGSTLFGASLNLYYKDNAYGGIMSCSPSKNSVTVMFQGMDESGSSEADVNDIPGSIMTFFYFDGNPEKEDLMCMVTAEGNLLSAIDPSITQEEAYDAIIDAYVDEKEVSFKGFKITPADMMQSQGAVIFKVSADK